MRVLVIGSNGQLGSALMPVLERNRSLALLGIDYPDIDLSDPESVDLVFGGFDPDYVINCAAYTAVADAETDEERALAINGAGPREIADQCRKAGAWLIHVSTDYVFDGTATSPYSEDAETSPASAYGRTKLAGEETVRSYSDRLRLVIIRISEVYGPGDRRLLKLFRGVKKGRFPVIGRGDNLHRGLGRVKNFI